jgi:SAM-dependent methyltransferase
MPKLEEWRQFYDGWAGGDRRVASTGHVVASTEFDRLGRTIADWIGLRGDERVLDVGCASGTLTSSWADLAGDVVGIDFSHKLVAAASELHGSERLRFEVAEAAVLPFADASFDCVVCFNMLLSLPDHDYVARTLAEIARVAAPNARIVLGSLPELRCQQRFFDVLLQEAPWWRRAGSRVKSWLSPERERSTRILWFDVAALRRLLERQGFEVEQHDDPPFANYRYYRKSLVLRRGEARRWS